MWCDAQLTVYVLHIIWERERENVSSSSSVVVCTLVRSLVTCAWYMIPFRCFDAEAFLLMFFDELLLISGGKVNYIYIVTTQHTFFWIHIRARAKCARVYVSVCRTGKFFHEFWSGAPKIIHSNLNWYIWIWMCMINGNFGENPFYSNLFHF